MAPYSVIEGLFLPSHLYVFGNLNLKSEAKGISHREQFSHASSRLIQRLKIAFIHFPSPFNKPRAITSLWISDVPS